MIVLVMLGPPGSGKGTQSAILSKQMGIPSLSTGQVLRDIMDSDLQSALSAKIKDIIERGDLVSDDLMSEVLVEKLKDKKFANGVILDGYPRNVFQAETLKTLLAKLKCKTFYVLYFDLPDSEVVDRLTGRYSCSSCKTQYHKKFHNPKVEGVCDICGSTEFSYRKDDAITSIKQRIKVYREQTYDLLDYYLKLNKIIKVDATNKIDEITNQVMLKLMPLLDDKSDFESLVSLLGDIQRESTDSEAPHKKISTKISE